MGLKKMDQQMKQFLSNPFSKQLKNMFLSGPFVGLCLSIVLPLSQAQAETPLSNQLPVEIVRELVDRNLWKDDFDSPTTRNAQDLTNFLLALKNAHLSAEQVSDQLFGNLPTGQLPSVLPQPTLYPVKYAILRHFIQTQSNDRLQQIYDSWRARYIETALSISALTGIEELRAIAERFRNKLKAGELKISDLSPAERARLNKVIHPEHGLSLTAQNPEQKGTYAVSGLFHAKTGYFALDFARPLEETLVTFIHEMIHAADPNLDTHRENYKKELPKAIAALSRWIGKEKTSDLMNFDFLELVYPEQHLDPILEAAQKLRQFKKDNLTKQFNEQNIEKNNDENAFKPSNEEIESLNQWIRSCIGLTVENEYRAYGFSIAAYSILRNRFRLLGADKERQYFVERLLSGDESLAIRLSFEHNPLPRLRNTTHVGDQETQKKIFEALDFVELQYLNITESFMKGLNNRFSQIIRDSDHFGKNQNSGKSALPGWAEPGNFDSPTNPYQILTARLTTAWTLRFRKAISGSLDEVQKLNEPLQTTRVGILDIHDISIGELRLLNIWYASNPNESVPRDLPDSFRADLSSISPSIKKEFTLVEKPASLGGSTPIKMTEVRTNLLKLRLLKTHTWLDENFPNFQVHIGGIRIFLEKLREKISVDNDDLTPERAKALEAELTEALKVASLTRDETQKLKLLMDEFVKAQQASEDIGLARLAESFDKRIRSTISIMESLGVVSDKSMEDIRAALKQTENQLRSQFTTIAAKCAKETKKSDIPQFLFNAGPIHMSNKSFPVSIVCHKGEIYVVRQPNNYATSMGTFIQDGAPESRIFNGSRKIRLEPLKLKEKQ